MKLRGHTATSIKYQTTLDQFTTWADGRLPGAISSFEIEGFLAEWQMRFVVRYDKEPSPDTRRNTVTALRSFYRYLDRFDLLVDASGRPARNPMLKIDPVRVRRRVKPWLLPEELDRLAAVARNEHQAFVVWFYALTGARAGEGSQVRLRDVDLTGSGRITIAGVKTDAAVRTIPLHPELRPLLIRHIERMRAGGFGGTTPILHTGHGTPLKQQQVGRWLAEMGERAGVGKRANAQMLRRSFGSILLNQGLRVEVVSKLMGHANVRVTMESYAELLSSQVEAEFFAIL